MSQLNLFSQPEGQLTDAERRQKLLDEFLAAKGAYLTGVKQKRAKKSRLDSISLLDGNDRASQLSFGHTTQIQPYPKGTFPPIGGIEKVKQILQSARSADWIGLDFEFSPSTGKITIIGVSTLEECAGAKWTPECKEWLLNALDRGVFLVGHWVLGADKPILENFIGEKTPASRWIDSMGLHFLAYQCLCKLPGKESDGEGSLGFMSLAHATAVHTDIPPGYKSCVGVGCLGELDSQSPCPSHNPTAYCAIDSFVGLVVATNAAKLMDRAHIPWACYEKWHELTLRCIHAENQGFRINKSFIDNFDAQIEEKKKQFFPQKGKKWEIFNPKSSKQTLEWFAGHGIHLRDAVGKPSTDKEVVLRAFEGRLANYGLQDFEEFEKAEDIKLTYPDEMLYKLFLYKDAGKGMKPWFDEKFLKFHDGAWWVHPRFNTTGASTTRLSSSAPNFQNITSRGWGLDVKKGLLARNEKSHVLGCDASQLEHRIIIYECGEKPPEGDFFKWLLGRADGKFEKAAERMHGVGRDIAKRVAHASNYAEGFKTLTKDRLREAHTVAQRDAGALRVFEDWTYCGEVVVFTGANLAQTLFGDKSYESRRKALELQFDIYFNAVPFVHEWHRRLSRDIERGCATLRTGHRLVLLDSPLKNFKAGAAFIGQGGGAQYVQDKMIQSVRPWAAQVHDEIIWDTIPQEWSDGDCLNFAEFLWKTDTPSFPGLLIPWKVKRGPSWGECKEISPPKAAN